MAGPSPIHQLKVEDKDDYKQLMLSLTWQDQGRSPSIINNKGNSDPFAAFAIPITPKENRILTFYREVILPATFNLDPKKPNVANARAKTLWNIHVTRLGDEGTALAFLGSNATLVAKCTDSQMFNNMSLVFRARSTTALRRKLARDTKVNAWVWWHIFMIWYAEIAAGNVLAAQTHGRMLSHLLQEYFQAGGGLLDRLDDIGLTMIELIINFLYADMNMATQLLVPPAFDVYEWLPKTFGPVISRIEAVLPPPPPDPWPLHPTLENQELSTCMKQCREMFTRWRRRASDGLPDRIATMSVAWMQYKWDICLGKLVHRYCMFKELTDSISTSHGLRDYYFAQQYIAISAVRWSRSSQGSVCGKNIWAGRSLAALRPALEQSLRIKGSVDWEKWKEVRLWALYVGAIAERSEAQSTLDVSTGWFRNHFARQVRDMGLASWDDVVQILRLFLFDSEAYEAECAWFEDTMEGKAKGAA